MRSLPLESDLLKQWHWLADGRKAVSVPAPDWQNPTIVWRPNVSAHGILLHRLFWLFSGFALVSDIPFIPYLPIPPQAYMPSTPVQDFPYNFEADVEHHNIWSTIPLTEERVLEVSLAVAPQLCNSVAGCSAPSCGLQEEALFLRLLPADLWNWVVEGC